MKDQFPLVPCLFLVAVVVGCAAVGFTVGGALGDVLGLGLGLLLGLVVFGILSSLSGEEGPADDGWRFDAGHAARRGPRAWLSSLRHVRRSE